MKKPPDQAIITHNTGVLRPENINAALGRQTAFVNDKKQLSATLNVLAHRNTGKIEKIGSSLHDTNDPNLVNLYVTTLTGFSPGFDDSMLVKLDLHKPNELSPHASTILINSFNQVLSESKKKGF